MRVVWEGWDGSRWDLLDPRSPTFALSLEGLGLPGFTQQTTKLGSRDGLRYESTIWDANTVILTIKVGDEYPAPGQRHRRRGAAWRTLDRSFRRSFSAEEQGRLIVITEVGERWLNLRLDAPFNPPPEINPAEIGTATYVIGLTADDEPWWVGAKIAPPPFAWSDDNKPFFVEDPDVVEPDEVGLYIAEDAATNTARLANPGDRPAWPEWWAQGPASEVHVGVGEDYVVLPFGLAEGRKVYINSRDESITDEAGNSLWELMGYADPTSFRPIPPGGESPLYIRLIGATSQARVGVSIVPRYEAPW